MDWDDFDQDDYLEFAKFRACVDGESMFPNDPTANILYCEVVGKPIEFVNRWSKTQYKVRVNVLNYDPRFSDSFKDMDALRSHTDSWLAGGKRLFGAVAKVKDEPQIKIIRVGKGFDTEYFASAFKPKFQKKLTKNKKQASSPKK